MCWPLVTWPVTWPDLVLSVTSSSNTCTRQLTPCRWFSTKCVLLDVIAHSLEDLWPAKHFIFDLTCDVNEIGFPSTNLTGLSNTVWILRICPVVSEKRGGLKIAPTTRSRYKQTPPGRGLNIACDCLLCHCVTIVTLLVSTRHLYQSDSEYVNYDVSVSG